MDTCIHLCPKHTNEISHFPRNDCDYCNLLAECEQLKQKLVYVEGCLVCASVSDPFEVVRTALGILKGDIPYEHEVGISQRNKN